MISPRCLDSYDSGSLKEKAGILFESLKDCQICPRRCRVNRLAGKLGVCKTGEKAKVYSYLCHHGEEPPISGENGSGTIFFSNCNLRCVYCQNYEFSQLGDGREVDERELASLMIGLQNDGCHNINFVTPTHVLPQILKALIIAIPQGLRVPLVYNTSGYELGEVLRQAEGIFDVYLPDARYADSGLSLKYSGAKDYPENNQAALKEMLRQVGRVRLDEHGVIESGLLIRHLVLPGALKNTESIMKFISQELGQDTCISLRSQYFPCFKAVEYREISRRLMVEEYQGAIKIMSGFGLNNGWIQDESGLDRFAGINIKTNI